MTKRKKSNNFELGGFSFPIDPNLDEALRRVVSEVLSGMTPLEPGAPIAYSINIRVDENGVPSISQLKGDKSPVKQVPLQEERKPMTEIIEHGRMVTVITEVHGADAKSLRVKASPTKLEICAKPRGRTAAANLNTIALPKEINPASAKARLNNGILEVTLEKGRGSEASSAVKVE